MKKFFRTVSAVVVAGALSASMFAFAACDNETHTHTYGDAEWTWANDFSSATATFTCADGDDTQQVTANVTSQTTTAATCTTAGVITYTATVTFGGETFTDTKTDAVVATGHTYGGAVWSWASDFSVATATFTCSACGDVQQITATITSETTTEATCTEGGVVTYTATATFEGKDYTDQKTDSIAVAAHTYGEVATYNADDGKWYSTCSECGEVSTTEVTDTTNYTLVAGDSAALTAALSVAQSGNTIKLSSGTYTMDSSSTIAEGVTIQGSGTDSTTLVVPETTSGSYTTGLVITNKDVAIKDVTLTTSSISSYNYSGVVVIKTGDVTLDNIVINCTDTSVKNSAIVINSFSEGTVTISNSTLYTGARTVFIVDGANGKVVLDNCDITGVYTFNVNSASSQDLVVEVTDCKLHGWTSYAAITSVSFTNTEFSQGSSAYDYLRPYCDTTFTNCTFDSSFQLGAGSSNKAYTFTNCYFADTLLTADNLYTLLDQDDISVLETCTITVDGQTVTVYSATAE